MNKEPDGEFLKKVSAGLLKHFSKKWKKELDERPNSALYVPRKFGKDTIKFVVSWVEAGGRDPVYGTLSYPANSIDNLQMMNGLARFLGIEPLIERTQKDLDQLLQARKLMQEKQLAASGQKPIPRAVSPPKPKPKPPKQCHRCKKEGHLIRECPEPPIITYECYWCSEKGHKERDCPSKKEHHARHIRVSTAETLDMRFVPSAAPNKVPLPGTEAASVPAPAEVPPAVKSAEPKMAAPPKTAESALPAPTEAGYELKPLQSRKLFVDASGNEYTVDWTNCLVVGQDSFQNGMLQVRIEGDAVLTKVERKRRNWKRV